MRTRQNSHRSCKKSPVKKYPYYPKKYKPDESKKKYCEICKKGVTSEVSELDHLIPRCLNGNINYNVHEDDNLCTLCGNCHNMKTRLLDAHIKRKFDKEDDLDFEELHRAIKTTLELFDETGDSDNNRMWAEFFGDIEIKCVQ